MKFLYLIVKPVILNLLVIPLKQSSFILSQNTNSIVKQINPNIPAIDIITDTNINKMFLQTFKKFNKRLRIII
mgnify:CR=1 FL=1